MLGRAALSAAFLLAVLRHPGPSVSAGDATDVGFSLCSHCFYRQTPPRGAREGPPLRRLCHSLPGGQAFATLHSTTCDTAVYSAFLLSHGWTETGGEEGGETVLVTENNQEEIQVITPGLLKGDWSTSSSADSPLQLWDSSVTALVRSSINPKCSAVGGDLFLVTGRGCLGPADGVAEECGAGPFWSAVCCDVPSGGEGGFSVGLVREAAEEGEKVVSVNRLEEMLQATELFSEGCGGTAGTAVDLAVEDPDSDPHRGSAEAEPGVETAEREAGTEAQASDAAATPSPTTSEEGETPEKTEAELSSVGHSSVVRTEQSPSSDDSEMVEAAEAETEDSTIVYIVSTTFFILAAPLRPVVSTITNVPGQVAFVLQEDLGVLAALPGDTLSLFHLVTSDLLSGVGSAADALLGIGETCFSGVYHCTSTMLGELLASCQTGVAGVGTLAGDTAGIFGGAVDNAWWVSCLLGGHLWEQSEGYLGTVVSEMGGQVKTVGGGLGTLVWRGGKGVGNVMRATAGLIMGMVEMVADGIRDPPAVITAPPPLKNNADS